MAVLLIVVLLLWASAVGRSRELESLPAKLEEAKASLTNALAENQKDKDKIAALQTQVADLRRGREMGGLRHRLCVGQVGTRPS